MLPEEASPGSPDAWLRHAQSDLELARISPPTDVLLEGLCFHAQQAAEKALKAVLVAQGLSFPKTHSIRMLLDLLPREIAVPEEVDQSAGLADYAVTSRYPGISEPVEEPEYREAVRLAEAVVSWAKETIFT